MFIFLCQHFLVKKVIHYIYTRPFFDSKCYSDGTLEGKNINFYVKNQVQLIHLKLNLGNNLENVKLVVDI